jgi:soluble lytic murein transglycosylase-like protein
MKHNKLPTLTVVNPLSDSPTIIKKANTFLNIVKSLLLMTVILFFSILGYYLNVQHEEKINIQQKIQHEQIKASNIEPGIVLDATAEIIKREGNIPLSVAKKYALWIYEAGIRNNVDPMLILAVMGVESKFNYRAVSPTGPIGLLQVAASWHKEKTTQVALFDPKHNINVGTQILKEYSDKSSTEVETLLRFNGSLGRAPVYAMKVLSNKKKYETEILDAVVKSI